MGYYSDEYGEMICDLWYSDKTTKEDKCWLDNLSTKKKFKFSEKEKVKEIYRQVFGQLPKPRYS